MTITETFYAPDRPAWRGWLAEHHDSVEEIWLVTYRKATGVPSLAYNDAVEEALCVGWIDGLRKGLDERRLAQRFTPRRPGSGYSQTNIERLRRLVAQDLVLPEVRARTVAVLAAPYVFPLDIEAALRANETVWANFQRYSEAYRNIRVAYVETGRGRPGEFEKRLAHLLAKTEADVQFGYGIEAYY